MFSFLDSLTKGITAYKLTDLLFGTYLGPTLVVLALGVYGAMFWMDKADSVPFSWGSLKGVVAAVVVGFVALTGLGVTVACNVIELCPKH
jgi:hypothetical protein